MYEEGSRMLASFNDLSVCPPGLNVNAAVFVPSPIKTHTEKNSDHMVMKSEHINLQQELDVNPQENRLYESNLPFRQTVRDNHSTRDGRYQRYNSHKREFDRHKQKPVENYTSNVNYNSRDKHYKTYEEQIKINEKFTNFNKNQNTSHNKRYSTSQISKTNNTEDPWANAEDINDSKQESTMRFERNKKEAYNGRSDFPIQNYNSWRRYQQKGNENNDCFKQKDNTQDRSHQNRISNENTDFFRRNVMYRNTENANIYKNDYPVNQEYDMKSKRFDQEQIKPVDIDSTNLNKSWYTLASNEKCTTPPTIKTQNNKDNNHSVFINETSQNKQIPHHYTEYDKYNCKNKEIVFVVNSGHSESDESENWNENENIVNDKYNNTKYMNSRIQSDESKDFFDQEVKSDPQETSNEYNINSRECNDINTGNDETVYALNNERLESDGSENFSGGNMRENKYNNSDKKEFDRPVENFNSNINYNSRDKHYKTYKEERIKINDSNEKFTNKNQDISCSKRYSASQINKTNNTEEQWDNSEYINNSRQESDLRFERNKKEAYKGSNDFPKQNYNSWRRYQQKGNENNDYFKRKDNAQYRRYQNRLPNENTDLFSHNERYRQTENEKIYKNDYPVNQEYDMKPRKYDQEQIKPVNTDDNKQLESNGSENWNKDDNTRNNKYNNTKYMNSSIQSDESKYFFDQEVKSDRQETSNEYNTNSRECNERLESDGSEKFSGGNMKENKYINKGFQRNASKSKNCYKELLNENNDFFYQQVKSGRLEMPNKSIDSVDQTYTTGYKTDQQDNWSDSANKSIVPVVDSEYFHIGSRQRCSDKRVSRGNKKYNEHVNHQDTPYVDVVNDVERQHNSDFDYSETNISYNKYIERPKSTNIHDFLHKDSYRKERKNNFEKSSKFEDYHEKENSSYSDMKNRRRRSDSDKKLIEQQNMNDNVMTRRSDTFNTKFSNLKTGSFKYSNSSKLDHPNLYNLEFRTKFADEEFHRFNQDYNNYRIDHIKVQEKTIDLFEMPSEYSLAHCVAEDFRMGEGIAVLFKERFKQVDKLLEQSVTEGGLAYLEEKNENGIRYIYYLVTKQISSGKPTYISFWSSLKKMRDHIVENNVQKLAVPRLGCGLDKLKWNKVKSMIEYLFKDVSVEIVACNFSKELQNISNQDWTD